MRRQGARTLPLTAALSAVLVFALGSFAEARTTEIHLIVKVDLQRLHPNAPPDEPLEPAPPIAETVRLAVQGHPVFRQVTVRLQAGDTAPNPRLPADFLRLVDRAVDDLVVVDLSYHIRLDSFRATGKAGVQGQVAVHSVASRRKVLSRPFTVVVSYPGDVTKEAVIQGELAARARGTGVAIEEIELGLLDAAVKERLAPELASALGAYNPGSLPTLSKAAVQESLQRMAGFLASAPDRRDEAIMTLEGYLVRFPDTPNRAEVEQRLRRVEQTGSRSPAQKGQAPSEWAAVGVSRALTAKELAESFERLVGSRLEVWSFTLDWREGTVVMTPIDKPQDFILEGAPPAMRELEADPNPIYLLVVGRRADPRIPLIDVKIPVVRWLGCPRTACPASN